MGRDKLVSHDGVVTAKNGARCKVSIISHSACSACHAKGLCSASELAEKVVDVALTPQQEAIVEVGQRVKVNLEESMGMRAVVLAYGLPAIILVAFLLYLHKLGFSELEAGLGVIAALVVYFFVLYLLRKKIGRRFHFTITDIG